MDGVVDVLVGILRDGICISKNQETCRLLVAV